MKQVTKFLIASPALLFAGMGIGLPLVFSHSPTGQAPNAALMLLGFALLGSSVLIPPLLIARSASLLKSRWWLYGLLAVLFWPVGTFICGLSLWEKR